MNKFDKALWYEIFEKKEYKCLDYFIKNSQLVLDIWWYKWYFSLYCLSINPDLEIHFFEPVKSFCEESKDNLKDYKNILFNDYWVWSIDKVGQICVEKNKWMQSSIFENNFMLKDFEISEAKFIDFNSYMDKIDKPCLVKMDIEWCEFEVLNSISKDNFEKIKTLFLEYHLIWNFWEVDLKKLLDKLSQIYNNVDIWENKYSPKLWYIFCN